MATKRASSLTDADAVSSKRQRFSPMDKASSVTDELPRSGVQASSRVDPTYGQRNALPGLDGSLGDKGQLSNPGERDAVAYLLSVRAEARAVPNLLVSDERAKELRYGNDKQQGWYSDGAYTGIPSANGEAARSSPSQPYNDTYSGGADPQETCYHVILRKFDQVHEYLDHARMFPPSQHTMSFPISDATERLARQPKWSYALRQTLPQTWHVIKIEQERVILGLERLETLLTPGNLTRREDCRKLGAWAFSLLGRCRKIGEMGSHDVAVLRQLGKSALWAEHKLRMRQAGRGIPTVAIQRQPNDGESEAAFAEEEAPKAVSHDFHGSASVDDENGQDCNEVRDILPNPGECERAEDITGAGSKSNNEASSRDAKEASPAADGSKSTIQDSASTESTEEDVTELERVRQELLAKVASTESSLLGPEEPSGKADDLSVTNADAFESETQALASLDMIVTIIGERFGQRDLLAAREVWGEMRCDDLDHHQRS